VHYVDKKAAELRLIFIYYILFNIIIIHWTFV